MLSKKDINQLPYKIAKQLRRVGDFFICTEFNKDLVGDAIVRIGNDIYYRFMNFIYLPHPPESLTISQVAEICDLRLEYLDKLVDLGHNRRVVTAITNCLSTNLNSFDISIKALDFGCGSGLSSKLLLERLPTLEMVGVDISERAILESWRQGLTTFLTRSEEPLPFETHSFDVIFAIFVMHFKIDIATLIELRRVLRISGKFVFNVYYRDINIVIQELKKAGFCGIEIWEGLLNLDTNHYFVVCTPIPPWKVIYH